MSLDKVIEGGYCIGCGTCGSVMPEVRVRFSRHGDLVAELPAQAQRTEVTRAASVCPFTAGDDEDAIGKRLFAPSGAVPHDEIGYSVATYAGYAVDYHRDGSSGGVVSWLLAHLLQSGLVDTVLHVRPTPQREDGRFFSYQASRTVEEVRAGSTSFYYPVSMDDALAIVREVPGRYAITGVPCFHKALRRLRQVDPVIDSRIRYQVGIVCGQMKSAHYMEYLTAMAGATGRPEQACFRRKVPGRPANDYAFEVRVATEAGTEAAFRVMNSRIGVNWGMGYFKPEACEVCDDVVAETADIAAMDAWLPKYVKDDIGWSLLVARTPEMKQLLESAASTGSLRLETVPASDVAESQRGGLNHRRKTLPYRLWARRAQWVPGKRFAASPALPWIHRLEQQLREHLRKRSRELWLTTGHVGDLPAFQRGMRLAESAYRWVGRLKRRFG